MKQVWIIHGGSSFSTYQDYLNHLGSQTVDYERLKLQQKWKPWIAQELHDYDVLLPTFPNGSNAVYAEWELYFEKLVPYFSNTVQLVGHSLGAMFLAKYLHQHTLDSKAQKIVLIAGAYDDNSLEDLGSFKIDSASGLSKNSEAIHLVHSKDDPVVPFNELAKFQTDAPDAISHIFEDRGHFNQSTFPELLELLQKD